MLHKSYDRRRCEYGLADDSRPLTFGLVNSGVAVAIIRTCEFLISSSIACHPALGFRNS
jgi:hypothetical protein